MKKEITQTITETKTFCDFCGNEAHYSDCCCIVCGKAACSNCSVDQFLILELATFPKFWPPHVCGLPTFHAYVCPTCSNKTVRKFNTVKHMTENRNRQCEKWHQWYRKQVNELLKWQEESKKNA